MMRLLIKIAAGLLMLAATVGACTVPVFRYALDRWRADDYELVAQEGWEEGEAGRALQVLRRDSDLNVQVAAPSEDRLVGQLRWPRGRGVLWSGPLTTKILAPLTSSPAREELAARILAGDSAVWVLVESGVDEKDEKFAARLEARLKYLQEVATLPPQDPNDPDSKLGPGPELKVGFSLLRVRCDDPQEWALVQMLAGPTGAGLLKGGEPFAAPVFARGRVLGAWEAEDLDAEGIDEVCLFLLGACSCQVKSLNPGWELLMGIDWDAGLMAAAMAAENGPTSQEALPALIPVPAGEEESDGADPDEVGE